MGVGPDHFGGQAHVDFWFFGFNIDVGDVRLGNPPISLADFFFFELIRSTGQPGEFRSTDTISSSMENRAIALHKWTVEPDLALVTTPDAVPGQPFLPLHQPRQGVRYQRLLTDDAPAHNPHHPIGTVGPTTGAVYSMPMHALTGATSSLDITVEHDCTRPVQLDAFILNPAVVDDGPTLIAPSRSPTNYVSLRLSNSAIQLPAEISQDRTYFLDPDLATPDKTNFIESHASRLLAKALITCRPNMTGIFAMGRLILTKDVPNVFDAEKQAAPTSWMRDHGGVHVTGLDLANDRTLVAHRQWKWLQPYSLLTPSPASAGPGTVAAMTKPTAYMSFSARQEAEDRSGPVYLCGRLLAVGGSTAGE
ncbi:hypothetical protein QBC33DRAFT_623972 [Phialemonium atrogriseum]|uniref:Uncharacterized protein n=1 Tax=Phialemonium atrogriseum TaxID=1093897 RepID=A0AAJ0BPN9_9PEZI|nr:uncharacterized protein QBC33DRAFT_623972 [Phialemonium atrogriseum]KAK1762016.1 hypothetical protein QBC33DRAFT_623972 [Phialemonium atrogriseum]